MHIHLKSRTVPADPDTIAQRTDVVARLGGMGHINPDDGDVNTEVTEWVAVVGDTEVPIGGYAIEQTASGTPALSLVLYPESLTIGAAPAVKAKGPETTAEPVKVWGRPARDPREGLPGWNPTVAQQVADQAQVRA